MDRKRGDKAFQTKDFNVAIEFYTSVSTSCRNGEKWPHNGSFKICVYSFMMLMDEPI